MRFVSCLSQNIHVKIHFKVHMAKMCLLRYVQIRYQSTIRVRICNESVELRMYTIDLASISIMSLQMSRLRASNNPYLRPKVQQLKNL